MYFDNTDSDVKDVKLIEQLLQKYRQERNQKNQTHKDDTSEAHSNEGGKLHPEIRSLLIWFRPN